MVPIGHAHALPALHLGFTLLHQGLRLLPFRSAGMGRLGRGDALLSSMQGLLRLAQTTEDSERIALSQIMHEVEQIWYTQALQARFGQLDQRLSPITHHIEHADSQEIEARLDPSVPGVVGTILRGVLGNSYIPREPLYNRGKS